MVVIIAIGVVDVDFSFGHLLLLTLTLVQDIERRVALYFSLLDSQWNCHCGCSCASWLFEGMEMVAECVNAFQYTWVRG